MSQGYIKLYRKIRQNPIFNDFQLYRLWSICLTEASHSERDQIIGKQTVHLEPGEFVTGRYDLLEMYNSGLKTKDKVKGEKTVYRWLETLEKGGYLTIKKTNKFSIVSIDNWGIYQGGNGQDEPNNDQQMTNKRPSNDQQMTTNKNVKNDNNDKNDINKNTPSSKADELQNEFEEFWSIYKKKVDKANALKKFKVKRKKFSFEVIMSGTKAYMAECDRKGTEKQFIKGPAGFLHGENFNDEREGGNFNGIQRKAGSIFEPSEETLEAQRNIKPLTDEEKEELKKIEEELPF